VNVDNIIAGYGECLKETEQNQILRHLNDRIAGVLSRG
jgi:hypothetical protein